uniref:Lipoyl-binding domain-containing protein n=2 Tax=Phaeomonas parva TaxID=124430 RepID=A0A7S1U1S9_9STRA|mmetsp:Transcript_27624/g.87564  ORF Transcript_27624/g.87564 Transcript_27624/m.87564 type:complete len:429 (+) Transcript_27624:1139-2425(+)
MNTRLQVEHPVTEEITGVDLVEWQLKVAAGQALPIASQEDIPPPNGHAIEARVYAENPNRGFLPSTGTLLRHREPSSREGVRVDTGVREGGEVTMYYDPMISKLIVWGEDRAAALRRLDDALANYEIAGVQSNLQFLKLTAGHPAFVAGGVSTGFLDEHGPGLLDKLRKPAPLDVRALAAFAVLAKEDGRVAGSGDLWQKTGFRSYGQAAAGIHLVDADAVDGGTEPEHAQEPIRVVRERNGAYRFSGAGFFGEQGEGQDIVVNGSLNEDGDLIADVNGRQYHCRAVVTIHSTDVREGAEVILSIAGGAAEGTEDGNGCRSSWRFTVPVEEYKAASSLGGGAATISAPMPGKVIAIKVGEGDSVSAGDPVVVLEAMKMEQVLAAPANAVVGSIFCSEGEQVADGTTLVALAAGEEEEASGGAGGAVAA